METRPVFGENVSTDSPVVSRLRFHTDVISYTVVNANVVYTSQCRAVDSSPRFPFARRSNTNDDRGATTARRLNIHVNIFIIYAKQ